MELLSKVKRKMGAAKERILPSPLVRREIPPMPYMQPRPPIRVAFAVHVMQVAGAEVLIEQMIQRLGNRIEPTIFCLDSIGTIGERLSSQGVPVICLDRKRGRDFGVSWRMAREIRQRRIQIVHAHQYTPFFYSALAKIPARNGFRLIFTEHGRHYPDVVSPLRRAVNRLFLNRFADAINACCDFSARAIITNEGFTGSRVEVIKNGIELSAHQNRLSSSEVRRQLGLDPHRRYVTMIARFHPVKDHPMLLRAFAQVAKMREDTDLLLVGDGPLRSQLEREVKELGIESRVRFLGIRRDVPELLQAADLFCLTSVSEAASLTLMEAMAAARPVVVTNVGGNPEIVRDGIEGYLVPRGDSIACAEAMLKILSNPELAERMGTAGQERIRKLYTIQTTVEAYLQLYRRLLG